MQVVRDGSADPGAGCGVVEGSGGGGAAGGFAWGVEEGEAGHDVAVSSAAATNATTVAYTMIAPTTTALRKCHIEDGFLFVPTPTHTRPPSLSLSHRKFGTSVLGRWKSGGG